MADLEVNALVEDDGMCPAVGFQKATVCVPVSVAPYAKPDSTVTKCCGDPIVVTGDKPCSGIKNGVCKFTLSQTICVEVPVKFGATTTVDEPYVECIEASAQNICHNCTGEE